MLCAERHELLIRSSANTSPVSYTTGGSLAARRLGSMCHGYPGLSDVHFLDVMCNILNMLSPPNSSHTAALLAV